MCKFNERRIPLDFQCLPLQFIGHSQFDLFRTFVNGFQTGARYSGLGHASAL